MSGKVYKVQTCKVCGRQRKCNGGTCSACHSKAHCKVCRALLTGPGVWCAACRAALPTSKLVNYGGDHRPARERELCIARYARRAAAGEPLFRGCDRA